MSRTLSLIVAAGCIILAPALTAEARPDNSRTPSPVLRTSSDTQLDFSHLPPSAQRMLRDFFAARQVQVRESGRRFNPTLATTNTRAPRPTTPTRTQHHTTDFRSTASANLSGQRPRTYQHQSGSTIAATGTSNRALRQTPTNLRTSHLPAEARRMLQDFFEGSGRQATNNPRFSTTRVTRATTATPNHIRTTTQTRRTFGNTTDVTVTQRTTRRPGFTVNRGALSGNRITAHGRNFSPRHGFTTNSLAWADDPVLREQVIRALGEVLNDQQIQQIGRAHV